MKIKVLIADDHTIVRAGLTALLGTEKDIEVVGEAKNGAEAVSNAVELHPDIVIMDLMASRPQRSSSARHRPPRPYFLRPMAPRTA